MTSLRQYLSSAGIGVREFARQTGLSAATVSRAASGKSFPRRAALRAIHAATEGAVTANDFVSEPERPVSVQAEVARAR